MATLTDLDLLLIGKTGNGKSHTGNSILKRQVFERASSSESVTSNMQYDVSKYKGRVIKIVDGPGVGDTRLDNVKATERVVNAMKDAIKMNPRGYHAFLLVVKFKGRFTQEDVDTVKLLKKIFGESFVRDFCILVMTYGDNFERGREETGKSFEQWCQNQTGVLKQLLDECCGKIVLFNNRARDEGEKDAQLDRLIAMVQGLAARGHRYSDNHFQQASDQREKAIIESKKPIISEASMQECSLILQELGGASKIEDPNEQLKMLNCLLKRTSTLLEKIREEDKGTNALNDVENNVRNTYQAIKEVIEADRKLEEKKEERKKQKADLEKQLKEQQKQFDVETERKNKAWDKENKRRKQLAKEREEREKEAERERERQHEADLSAITDRNENMQIKITRLERERREAQMRHEEWLLSRRDPFASSGSIGFTLSFRF